MSSKSVYTIGHSTHAIGTFIEMLRSFNVALLADIRNFPGSRRCPQFGSEALASALAQAGIGYVHLKALGGRRKPRPDSPNRAWRVEAFRGYADYMETDAFKAAAAELERLALERKTAYMCSEAVWWSCHRALVSDYLKARGWQVLHIMKAGKVDEHPFTKPARIIDGRLSYHEPGLWL